MGARIMCWSRTRFALPDARSARRSISSSIHSSMTVPPIPGRSENLGEVSATPRGPVKADHRPAPAGRGPSLCAEGPARRERSGPGADPGPRARRCRRSVKGRASADRGASPADASSRRPPRCPRASPRTGPGGRLSPRSGSSPRRRPGQARGRTRRSAPPRLLPAPRRTGAERRRR